MTQKDVDSLMQRSEVIREGGNDTEMVWYRDKANLRGQFDYCNTQHVLLARNNQGLWNCWKCHKKLDAPVGGKEER